MNEARKRLADVTKDSPQYSELLEGLVLQVTLTAWLSFYDWLVIGSKSDYVFARFRGSISCWNLKLRFVVDSKM